MITRTVGAPYVHRLVDTSSVNSNSAIPAWSAQVRACCALPAEEKQREYGRTPPHAGTVEFLQLGPTGADGH